MKAFTSIVWILAISLFVSGCKKPSACISSGGGTGGSGIISVSPEHYGLYIDTCTIYIKYGTLDAPANGSYDDSQVCHLPTGDTVPVATFTNLKAGLYYFYGYGHHVGYSYVSGGKPYTLCTEKATNIFLTTYAP